MIKEIKYNGFSASPSDYECLDGDLATIIGLVPQQGTLKPIAPPKTILTLDAGQKVVAIHTTSAFTHYIIQDSNNKIYWRDSKGNTTILLNDFGSTKIIQITAIGNTLVTLCDNALQYFLWKTEDSSYIFLGDRIPECPISFGLQLQTYTSAAIPLSYNLSGIYHPFNDSDKENITSSVLAQVNKMIAERTANGEFMYPFFVRYAYRLFNGSLSHHSAPILMVPTTRCNPIAPADRSVGTDYVTNTSAQIIVSGVAASLDYKPLISDENLTTLNKWGDIVKSIDIFISAPIYTYDMSGEIEKFIDNNVSNYALGKNRGASYYQNISFSDLFGSANFNAISLQLPTFTDEQISEKVANCGTFYFLSSIELEDLPKARTALKIDKGSLGSLVTHEVMTDDYQTHETKQASFGFAYNSRLNIANVIRNLFKGYDPASILCYLDYSDGTTPLGQPHIYTHINGDEFYMIDSKSTIDIAQDLTNMLYFFYPDSSAKAMTIRTKGTSGDSDICQKINLAPHSALNGAAYFRGFHTTEVNTTWTVPAGAFIGNSTPIISAKNKIYTSEINNPFYFPLLGINSIGMGEVLGISTAAKALSEGQFGQFPLYAFTTDGVWALEVSATGAYSSRQPITRDVCISQNSITQIDNAVLFVTDRGIMLLSGSQSICISDILDNEEVFPITNLIYHSQLLNSAGVSSETANIAPFKKYIDDCRMLYDYINQRIIVYNSQYRYAYVYSLESKAWGMMPSNIASGVNAYPEALATLHGGNLVDFSHTESTEGFKGIILTRPIKLDEPNTLKTITTVIQRGIFQKEHVKTAIYGSRDLNNWLFIASSKNHYLRGFRGTSYKYFRIAIVCDLDHDESLWGCTIQYTAKQTNQPR